MISEEALNISSYFSHVYGSLLVTLAWADGLSSQEAVSVAEHLTLVLVGRA